eukprot:SAG31_NODE_4976_length_2823_cov_1.737885_4_plen_50_part_00
MKSGLLDSVQHSTLFMLGVHRRYPTHLFVAESQTTFLCVSSRKCFRGEL